MGKLARIETIGRDLQRDSRSSLQIETGPRWSESKKVSVTFTRGMTSTGAHPSDLQEG